MAEAIALPVRGSVDLNGLLASADPPLARLQQEAGGSVGSPLAIPQLAALVRLARKLNIKLSRPALAGTASAELDLWVRVEPAADEVRLVIERWTERPAPTLRWTEAPPSRGDQAAGGASDFELDAQLRIVRLASALARQLGAGADGASGVPLTRLLQLQADEHGELPLLAALASRGSFEGQIATSRDGMEFILSAEPVETDGKFAGYRGRAVPRAGRLGAAVPESAEWGDLLREPIDIIMTEASRIADKAEGPLRSDYAGYATDIAAAARHLLDVLGNMNREVAGASDEAEAEAIDLAALAAEAAGLVQPQAAEAGVMLELEGVTSLPSLGQSRAVTQILVNLIGNAVRYSPKGSAVRIEAEAGARASVTISDQGPGVAAKDRDRIFEPFEQAGAKKEGAGLGLAISRRLARSMGGDISLESTPGKGARFTLTLPPR